MTLKISLVYAQSDVNHGLDCRIFVAGSSITAYVWDDGVFLPLRIAQPIILLTLAISC